MVVVEEIWKKISNPGSENGFMRPGEVFHLAPLNMRINLDFDAPPGKCGSVLLGWIFRLRKMGYEVRRLSDVLEVSPVHAQYYQLTMQQKQQLEQQIKQGLAGITSAVSDFELLFHDLRKYKEFMDLFNKIEVGIKTKNEQMIKEANQSMKAIFIDQVDVHTGEGIALKLIISRWPTIIGDFYRLDDSDTDMDKIAKKYNLSTSAGVVLATKNKLFIQWKKMFFESVVDRYVRIKELLTARKKSIDEYRNMLRPYIKRYRSLREMAETQEGRKTLIERAQYFPAGTATSVEIAVHWAWKSYQPTEMAKVTYETLKGETVDVLKSDFPSEFKSILREKYKGLKEKNLNTIKIAPSGIEPLDRWTLAFIPDIENYYKVKITWEDILETRKDFVDKCIDNDWRSPYFICHEFKSMKSVFRLPDGSELENIVMNPFMPYLDRQNIMLLRMIELKAIEKEEEKYIAELLGESEDGRKLVQLIQDEYPTLFEVEKEVAKETGGETKKKAKDILEAIYNIKKEEKAKVNFFDIASKLAGRTFMFTVPGKYESRFDDRVTGPYFTELADGFWKPAINFWKAQFGVPGFELVG